MELQLIRQKLHNRYIEPTKPKRPKYIGIEIEMPVVNLSKKAVDFQVIHKVTNNFISYFKFTVVGTDDEGNVFSAQNPVNGDILSYDCSYNNLELSFGKEENLFTIQNRFFRYYNFLQKEFNVHNYTLTGMGINPYRNFNHNVPIPNGRYRMLFHHLNSYKDYLDIPMYFHHYPEYGTFSSASQVQLDVEYDKLVLTLNTFSKLEPIKALLFSNSVLMGEDETTLCCRDMFWENSTHGINPHNIGMYDCEFETVDDILSYIETTSIYCLERNGKYINFPPIRLDDYFNRQSVTGMYFDKGFYKKLEIEPCFEDLDYLRTFKFIDLTFRGTIEFRSVCCQPISDSLCVAAFHVGLMEKLEELSKLLENDRVLYHHGYTPSELRKFMIKRDLPEFIDTDKLYILTKQVIDLAYDGLISRRQGEEKLLEPLYQRISLQTNPAKTMIDLKNSGVKLEEIIKEYAKIKQD
ncbi:MAG: glutamylcysteine synthetase [Ruminococcus sp.]